MPCRAIVRDMTRTEISSHEVRVFQVLRRDRWATVREIAAAAEVARRTAHLHLQHFVKLGLAEKVKVFPGHGYRLLPQGGDKDYRLRLAAAATILRGRRG